MSDGPLEGYLVVAVEQAISAPTCTRALADLGARVIKVEPLTGDFARDYDDTVKGMSAHFTWANRNKESISVNLKDTAGREILGRLVARADVVVQNLAPGAADRLGLAPASLRAAHPRLVVADISGYGVGGPQETYRAYDLLVQAEAGSCAITGTPEVPAKPGIPLADIGAGLQTANAILAALLRVARTGEGSAISVGMFDVVTDWLGWALNQRRYTGADLRPNGVSSPTVAPYGGYATGDGQTLVLGTTNDREWHRLATDVIGRPDLAADPRFASNAQRVALRSELDAAIGAWAATVTLLEGRAIAQAAGIGHARLNSPGDLLEHPQLLERQRWQDVSTPVGPVPSLLPAANSDSWSPRMDGVPGLGEHSLAILEELGFAETDRRQLVADGIVKTA